MVANEIGVSLDFCRRGVDDDDGVEHAWTGLTATFFLRWMREGGGGRNAGRNGMRSLM